MFTDIVGYTALAQRDEASALKRLDRHNRLLRPIFPRFHGREVKAIGDSFLVEFQSALDATNCAIEIQRLLDEDSVSAPEESRVRLRIGIHLGDVVHKAGDVFGDSVNIASRIEPLAEPGGICISEPVFGQVRNKIPNQLEKLEPKVLKNVRFPMDVYRIVLPWTVPGAPPASSAPTGLAVLPFTNISPDPKDEYFADGLTEELIMVLSQLRDLRVIARTSVMQYKTTSKTVSQIGADLGVSSILEGSVRKAGNRLRVTAQLIDVGSQGHVWAHTYDRELDDVFAVQSDIAAKVAGSLPGNLAAATAPAPAPKETGDIQAYTYFLQGQALMYERAEEPLRQSLRFFEQALERDPSFSRAYAGTARCYIALGNAGFIPFAEGIERGRAAAEKACSISPDLAEAHAELAALSYMACDPVEVMEKEVRRALELNPNLAEAYVTLGLIDELKGDRRAWVSHCETAYRLDPLSPRAIRFLGEAYFLSGRGEVALEHWKRTLHLDQFDSYRGMTDYYIAKGDLEKAGPMVKELERLDPTNPYTYLSRGQLAALTGDKATATEMIAKRVATHEKGWVEAGYAGYIYLALGDVDRFFECMFTAAKDHTLDTRTLMYSPLFAEVRKDPRFEQLLSVEGIAVRSLT